MVDGRPGVALIADVTQIGRWSPETTSAGWLDSATGPSVGARFRGHNRRRVSWSTTCTVTECEPGRSFAFEVGKGETGWAYRLEPLPGGCRVEESFDIVRPPGLPGRMLTRLGTGVSWANREADLLDGMRETLRRLKEVAESRQDDQ